MKKTIAFGKFSATVCTRSILARQQTYVINQQLVEKGLVKLDDLAESSLYLAFLTCVTQTTEANFDLPKLSDFNAVVETFKRWANDDEQMPIGFFDLWREVIEEVNAPLSPVALTPDADPNA